MIRREQLTGGLDLGPDPDLRAVIRDRYGLAPSWGGCYRRVRYNVLLESLRSGHVFSVMFDRCTDSAGRVSDLHQAEVEYIRSRVVSGRSGDDLMGEFGQLCAWTRQVLDRCGVDAEQNNLSKLTWLRQARSTARQQQPCPLGEPQVMKLVACGLSAASCSRRRWGPSLEEPGFPAPPCCGGTCLYRVR